MMIVDPRCQSSIESETQQETCLKALSLFESQFMGDEKDKPAKLFEFLDQMRTSEKPKTPKTTEENIVKMSL